MFTLYDEERIMKNHDADLKREERDKGIKGFVDITKKVGGSMIDVIEQVVSTYGVTKEEAEKAVKKYWE